MPETPQKVRAKVDDAIRELNANWDLHLPALHGAEAESAERTSAVAMRCSARLRYLSFRLDSLTELLKDFDTRARHMYSKWTMKPAQEKGTLPILPVQKSFLHRDITRRRVLGLHRLTKDQQDRLLDLLDRTLKDDYDLARTSDSYQRTSQASRATSWANSATRRHSPRLSKSTSTFTSPRINQQNAASNTIPSLSAAPLQQPTMIRKRSSDGSASVQSKRKRPDNTKQTTLDFGHRASSTNAVPGTTLPARSFDTVASSSPSDLLDTPKHSNTSSTRTSILDEEDALVEDPVQGATEYSKNETSSRSFGSSSITASSSTEDFLAKAHAVFSSEAKRLPSGLGFDVRYELESLAQSWDESPLDVFKQVEKLCKVTQLTHEERWVVYKKLCVAKGRPPLSERFGTAWLPSLAQAPGQENHRSTYLNVSLDWTTKASDKSLFNVKFRGPATDKSCRFHRIFGGDRFITLHLPVIQRENMPSHLRPHQEKIKDAIVQWLTSEHHLAGRTWRAFWIDDGTPKVVKDKLSCNVIYLFAERGVGLDAPPDALTQRPDRCPMSVGDFINFHAPIEHNIDSTDLKLFARFKLGLSKTTPTVILQQQHFRSVPDKIGTDGVSILNDGCAMMSPSLALAISKHMGLNEMPSAFQGRIGGAKGLWLVDYTDIESRAWWIEITPSQNKIEPHPKDRDVCDEYRQFEVSDYAKPPQQTALNTQFLTVLSDRGVEGEALKRCLEEQVYEYYDTELCAAMSRPALLKAWTQKYHRSARDSNGVDTTGAFPRDRSEKINVLVDAGFSAQECTAPIREQLRSCMRDHLNLWAEKLKIEVRGESTFLFCAPDPSGTLKPGEVFCSLSQGWTNPRNGAVSYFVHDIMGLVARNPANHPSDIQRVKFVFKPELQSYRDVLIFPSVGVRSLASLLSGGDYDGDKCLAIWRPDLVKGFTNYTLGPPDHITAESCGLIRRSQRLSTLMPHGINVESVNSFLLSSFDFNLKPSLLGICTNAHEKLVYNTSLTNKGAIKLAALASFLVDSRKQGLELTQTAWDKVRAECYGTSPTLKPAYKHEDVSPPSDIWNVIDYLRFKVAQVEVRRVLENFHQNWPNKQDYDSYFSSVWTKALARAPKGSGTWKVLTQLKEDVNKLADRWLSLVGGSKITDDPGRHPERVRVCFEQLLEIKPLVLPQKEEIHWRYEDEQSLPYSNWSRLRASCFYSEKWRMLLTWYMVGQELCFMNAQRSEGATRIFTAQMHAITKVDTRAVRSHEVPTEVTLPSFSGPIVQYLG